jgi:hypothetical protein
LFEVFAKEKNFCTPELPHNKYLDHPHAFFKILVKCSTASVFRNNPNSRPDSDMKTRDTWENTGYMLTATLLN